MNYLGRQVAFVLARWLGMLLLRKGGRRIGIRHTKNSEVDFR